MGIRPKKSLGQHFLSDHNIAQKIIAAVPDSPANLMEIGPGTGVLTRYILDLPGMEPIFVETDQEAVEYLQENLSLDTEKIVHEDFLKVNLQNIVEGPYQIVGNLPYNISSQIFFRMLEDRHRLSSAVVMIQKEVADRIRSGPGSKVYGILSVLLQTWFDIEYLFTVSPGVFIPPPKVKSAVIRLTRNEITDIGCDPAQYFRVVKAGFNQRRKTLRNALKSLTADKDIGAIEDLLSKRAEQLCVEEFIRITKVLESKRD